MSAAETGNGSAVTTSDQLVMQDLQTFRLDRHQITLVSGSLFVCPPSNWGKEEMILDLLKDLVVPMLKLGVLGGQGMTPDQQAQMTQLVLEHGPEKLTKAMTVLTGKDDVWVRENLTLEGILGCVIPFFVSKRNSTVDTLVRSLGLDAAPSSPSSGSPLLS